MVTETLQERRVRNRGYYHALKRDPSKFAVYKQQRAAYVKQRRRTDPSYQAQQRQFYKNWLNSAKEGCINMYSNGDACCAWCPQADIDVLCLDHIDEGQTKAFTAKYGHRGGKFLFAKLRQQGYPPGFQVLCASCNLKKEILRRRKRHGQ